MSVKPKGAPAVGAGGVDDKPDRPLGPDGKPIPGPEQMRQIQVINWALNTPEIIDQIL